MSEPPLSYEVEARIVRAGVSEIRAKQERITFDSSPGMSEEIPGPAELLCGAFAACVLKNVERFSEMLPFAQHGASVRVIAEREQAPSRFTTIRYELRIVTDEPSVSADVALSFAWTAKWSCSCRPRSTAAGGPHDGDRASRGSLEPRDRDGSRAERFHPGVGASWLRRPRF